jgi:HYR domain
VSDTEPPTIAAPPNVSVIATSAAGAVIDNATLGIAAAADNCPGVTVAASGVPTGNLFPIATTTLLWTATDSSGNTASATQTVTVAYGICLLYDPTRPAKLGSTIAIKVQLCTASGTNLSAAALVLHVTSLSKTTDTTTGTLEDPGNTNADNDFRYDATLGTTGGYIYHLSTKSLSSGTWLLHFTVDGQGDYTVSFQLR